MHNKIASVDYMVTMMKWFIIWECSKIAQKEYMKGHDWMGKVKPLELCKNLKVDHIDKLYTHKLESVRENETHKILRNFEIKMEYLISVKKHAIYWTLRSKWTCQWKSKNNKEI